MFCSRVVFSHFLFSYVNGSCDERNPFLIYYFPFCTLWRAWLNAGPSHCCLSQCDQQLAAVATWRRVWYKTSNHLPQDFVLDTPYCGSPAQAWDRLTKSQYTGVHTVRLGSSCIIVIVGVYKHSTLRHSNRSTECISLGYQWNDGSLGVTEPSPEIHEP